MSDDDDQDDDPGLRSMRAVWLSMRDEEPPAAGLSGLLAAAREKADAMRPKAAVPWWQRALAVLRRPPVLALASVVVVLGGAIALTTRSDDMKAEPPQAAERQRAPTEDRAKLEAPAPAPAPAAVQPPQVAQEPDHEQAEAETKKDVKAPKPPVVHRAPPARTQAPPAPDRYGGEDVKAPEPPPPPERPAKERDSRSEGGLAIATDGRAPEVAGEAAPPQVDETIETTGSTGGKAQTSTAQLVQQCETAAARGDCAATRVTAAKIKKLDAAVYKARIQSNQAIARCLK